MHGGRGVGKGREGDGDGEGGRGGGRREDSKMSNEYSIAEQNVVSQMK